jgi:hypothetical protein
MATEEGVYFPGPDFLQEKQPNIPWGYRAVLFDWLQEVCADYLFKRETYYYAINYIDRYLDRVTNLEK